MKKLFISLAVTATFVVPTLVLAQIQVQGGGGQFTGVDHNVQGNYQRDVFDDTASVIQKVMRLLVPAATALLVVVFFYGLAKYVLSAGDPEKAKEGKNIMLYGALAMFVGLAIWGIISYIVAFFGVPERQGQFEVRLPDVNRSALIDLGSSIN